MKALKYLLWTIAAIVILVIGAVAIIAATFDPNKYKPDLVKLVQERYGRTLAIEGDIALTFFPRLGAALGKTTLSEPREPKTFASIGEAKVSVALLPLLQKQVIVDRVQLSGLEVQLVKRKDGRTNFDDLLGKADKPGKEEKPPAPKGPGDAEPVVIDVSGIALTNASIGWRDEAAGTDLRLSNVELNTGRIASGVPGKLRFSARAQGTSPKMDARVQLATGYTLDLGKPAANLPGLDLRIEGDVPGLAALKAALTGDIAWAGGNRIELREVKLEAASAKDGLDVQVTAPRLLLSPERSESAQIDARLKRASAGQKVDAKLALAAVKASGQRIEFSSLGVELDLAQDDLGVRGKLATPVMVNLETSEAALSRLAGELTISGPTIPNKSMKLALEGSGQANWAKRSAAADIAAKFDESNARLKLALADYAKPAPQFDLTVDRLNVDRYLPPKAKPAGGGGGGAAGGGKPAAAPEKPFDLSGLKDLAASGSARVGSLVASNVKAQNVQVTLRAGGGRLDLSPIAASLYQGSLAGSASINANTNQFVVKQQLSNVAVGPLLRDAAEQDLLEGRGTVALDVTTAGNTVSALKRALNGTASLNLRDGAIKGVNLADIARRARELRKGDLAAAGSGRTEKTDFSELTASFVIRNGVARNEDLNVKSPFIRVSGAGDVNIPAESLDYLVKASAVATTTGQGGRTRDAVRGITVPVRLTGPFDNIGYSVDVNALVTETAKEEIKQRVEEKVKERLDEELKGRLGEQLKGLFGR